MLHTTVLYHKHRYDFKHNVTLGDESGMCIECLCTQKALYTQINLVVKMLSENKYDFKLKKCVFRTNSVKELYGCSVQVKEKLGVELITTMTSQNKRIPF